MKAMVKRGGLPLIVVIVLSILAAPPVTAGQQPAAARTIGLLYPGAPPPPTPRAVEWLTNGLRQYGYGGKEGVPIEVRYGSNRSDRLSQHAHEFVRRPVAVIVAFGDNATRAAQQATATIPIVAAVGEPVRSGFAASLARPGGNITGVSRMVDDLLPKRLELLKEMVPGLRRVAVLWDPVGAHVQQVQVAQGAARALGLEILTVEARERGEIEGALDAARREQAGGLLVLVSPFLRQFSPLLGELTDRKRLPAVGDGGDFVAGGGLISYGPDDQTLYSVDAARIVDRVLKGAKPADLPFQQPTRFELAVNLKTAKGLGLTAPQTVLVRATQVIQ